MSGDLSAAARILDANANRASEGLRVVEDYCRFGLNDRGLSESTKQIRHQLVELLKPLMPDLIRKRDVRGDVGGQIRTEQEYHRAEIVDVVRSSCKRAQQALRSIEEFAKIRSARIAMEVEQLRYRAYDLEVAIHEMHEGKRLLSEITICALIDCAADEQTFADRVDQLFVNGIRFFQLRDKHADDRLLVQRFGIMRERTSQPNEESSDSRAMLIINDRIDIAHVVAADGVHLGQDDLPVSAGRKILGADKLIGVSTHSIEQARQAVMDGANYIGVGPTFPSQTKQFESFPGLELATSVAQEIGLPAFAIGGISSKNVRSVVDCGIRRVAVAGALWGNPEAKQEIQHLNATLNEHSIKASGS